MLSLKDFTSYAPNCLICGKQTYSSLLYSWGLPKKYIYLTQKDNILYNKYYNINIDVTSSLINNSFICNTTNRRIVELKKHCITCVFDISFHFDLYAENPYQINNFYLSHEIIKFTAPKIAKPIELINYYSKDFNNKRTVIYVNDKDFTVKDSFLQINNIKNFSELKRKIKTMLLFG